MLCCLQISTVSDSGSDQNWTRATQQLAPDADKVDVCFVVISGVLPFKISNSPLSPSLCLTCLTSTTTHPTHTRKSWCSSWYLASSISITSKPLRSYILTQQQLVERLLCVYDMRSNKNGVEYDLIITQMHELGLLSCNYLDFIQRV